MTARVQLENKGREKSMVVSLKGLCAKMNWLAIKHQSYSNSDSDTSCRECRVLLPEHCNLKKKSSLRNISTSLHFTQRRINLLSHYLAFARKYFCRGLHQCKTGNRQSPTPEGGVTQTSLPLFLVMLARNQRAPIIFKFTTLCTIVIKT
jgi:hypothetical protein